MSARLAASPDATSASTVGIGRHELPRVSRTIALELLDEILADWKLVQAPHGTITGVNLSPVVQSELERMFKVLLQRWGERGDVRVTAHPDPDHAARTRFDVRFQDGPHWQIREQVNLANHHTKPDFYATRVDATGTPPVAIYLDGWAFHQDPDQVDGDATKRASLRAAGTRVWTLTYSDVKACGGRRQRKRRCAVRPHPSPAPHAIAPVKGSATSSARTHEFGGGRQARRLRAADGPPVSSAR